MSDSTAADRRTFLQMVAGGALGASTSGIVANSVAQEGYAGKLVFTYDDGVVEDYEQAYQQAHKDEGVPACTAMISSRVNTSNSLSESQLHELQNAGWEIMSHTVTHRALTDVLVTRDVEPGDERIYVRWNQHGEHTDDTILLSDSNKSEVVTVSGQGNDGAPYVSLKDEVSHSYSAYDTIERYTDDIIRTELKNSQEQLQGYGLSVTNAVMPYAAYGDRTQEIVSDYYTAVANAGVGNPGEVNGEKALNPVDDLNLPHLSRRYFREDKMTYDEIAAYLDRVAQEDVLGIFGGHTWWDRSGEDLLPPERIRDTIQMAKDRNIEIVTLQQALDDLGYTGGSPTTTTTTEEPTTTTSTSTTTTSEPTTTESTSTTTTETTTDTTTETTTDTTTETTTDTTTETTTDTTDTTETTETTDTTETTETTDTTETTETTTATTTETKKEEPNKPPDPPDTETTTQNDGGGGGGSAPTTTTTTQTPTTTRTTTAAPTTTEPPTTMPLADETSTMTETMTRSETSTSTSTETPSLTGTTKQTGNPEVRVPGFGWLATFGMAGSLAAYAVSRLNGDDDE